MIGSHEHSCTRCGTRLDTPDQMTRRLMHKCRHGLVCMPFDHKHACQQCRAERGTESHYERGKRQGHWS